MFDYRKLLETPCSSCIIDVVGWKPLDANWPQAGEINIELISGYDYCRFKTWRGKLERIGQVLKGESHPVLFSTSARTWTPSLNRSIRRPRLRFRKGFDH